MHFFYTFSTTDEDVMKDQKLKGNYLFYTSLNHEMLSPLYGI